MEASCSLASLINSAAAADVFYRQECELMGGDTSDSDSEAEIEREEDAGTSRASSIPASSAPSLLTTLLVGALATLGRPLERSEQNNAVITGAEACAQWRSVVHEQMRTECYSRQCVHELGSRDLQSTLHKHTIADIPNARVRTPQKTAAKAVYQPCTFANAAYRRTEIRSDGRADLQRIQGMLVDLGASISVLDSARAKRMARNGAAEIVRYKDSRVVPARVAGGGYISIIGVAIVEFCLQDSQTLEWRPFKERFHIVEGSKTCILGMTFHAARNLNLNLSAQYSPSAHYTLDDGSQFETDVDIYMPGMVATAMASSDPLIFTREKQDVTAWGFSIIKCAVPESCNGAVIHLSRLPDLNAFANKVGLMVPEASFEVKRTATSPCPSSTLHRAPFKYPLWSPLDGSHPTCKQSQRNLT